MGEAAYLRRTVDVAVDRLLADRGAALISGPRGCGKTTTAAARAASVVRLDVPAQAAIYRADPDVALAAAARPALLDEWQFVPEVMGAVKRAVDADPHAGPVLLTGSAQANRSPDLWAGTGRVSRIAMFGLTEAEIAGRPDLALIDRLRSGDLRGVPHALSIWDYLELAVRGGMPAPRLRHLDAADWYADYLDQIVDRDLASAGFTADADRLSAYLIALAENTAGTPSDVTVNAAAGIVPKTANRYNVLLENLGLLDRVPAWTTNRLSRLSSRHKIYLTDTGLAAAALGIDAADALADGTLFGRMIDTLVAAQLRPFVVGARPRARLYHLRTSDGRREVDLIVDLGHRGVIAIEVKAAAAVSARDARHLAWLRDALGPRFLRGIVFHTGPDAFAVGERIIAAPISSLWAEGAPADRMSGDERIRPVE